MRSLMATDCILAFPDHNKPFVVELDASDYQLGAVIKQEGRAVAYYSRKLTSAQKNSYDQEGTLKCGRDASYFSYDAIGGKDCRENGSQESYSQVVFVYDATCHALASAPRRVWPYFRV